jgi:hypothetical protein
MADKNYTPFEVAQGILNKVQELYKNNKLAKANTSHEIELGGEPSNDEADFPESMASGEVTAPEKGDGKNKKNKKPIVGEVAAEGEIDNPEENEELESEDEEELGEENLEHEESESPEEEVAEEGDEAEVESPEEKAEETPVEEAIEEKNKKKKEIKKSLFSVSDLSSKCCSEEPKKTKEDTFRKIQWCVDDIKRMKELRWTIEQDAPEAKDVFEKEFAKHKAKLAKLVKEYSSIKKGEQYSGEEGTILIKAEKVLFNNPLKKFVDKMNLKKQEHHIMMKEKMVVKKQGVPANADPAIHEACVHDVKAKGHDKSSAFAICNAAKAGQKKNKTKKIEKFLGLAGAQTPALGGGVPQEKAPKVNLKNKPGFEGKK